MADLAAQVLNLKSKLKSTLTFDPDQEADLLRGRAIVIAESPLKPDRLLRIWTTLDEAAKRAFARGGEKANYSDLQVMRWRREQRDKLYDANRIEHEMAKAAHADAVWYAKVPEVMLSEGIESLLLYNDKEKPRLGTKRFALDHARGLYDTLLKAKPHLKADYREAHSICCWK